MKKTEPPKDNIDAGFDLVLQGLEVLEAAQWDSKLKRDEYTEELEKAVNEMKFIVWRWIHRHGIDRNDETCWEEESG